MKHVILLTVGLMLVLLVNPAVADSIRSGPQAGEEMPGPFEPLNVTGEDAGKHECLYCKNGLNPVAMIFARELSPTVVTLIKKVDAATGQNAAKKMGSFIVFLSDDQSMAGKLKELARKEDLTHIVLCTDKPAGPEAYKVAKDAEVTVILYTDITVRVNHAFKKGELNNETIQSILADLPKIMSK